MSQNEATPEPPAASGRALGPALGVAALALLVLAAYAPLFGLERLHVQDAYLDQAGYITTARILADTGRLQNGIVLPSLIEMEPYHVHMPGHSALLALSYVLFDFGVLSSLLPSLAGYVLATLGVFLIGARLYGRRAGFLAAALFALFPANVVYAYTAMAELTFLASVVLALLAFVYLPPRLQPLAPCVILIGPFLFRESGAFLVLPMALVVLRSRGLLQAAFAVASSVSTLACVHRWQVAGGKIAASLTWVTRGEFNYSDAFVQPTEPLTAIGWLGALGANLERNLRSLGKAFAEWPGELMPWCLFVLLALTAVALSIGLARFRRDAFPLGAALLLLLVLVLTLAVYDAKEHKVLRSAMFAYPLGAIAVAGALATHGGPRASRVPRPRIRSATGVLLGGAALVGSVAVTRLGAERLIANDAYYDEATAWYAWLNPDKKLIVAPPSAGAKYAVEHYPARWSLTSSNERTLGLVLERYDAGVVQSEFQLSPAFLERHDLALALEWGGIATYVPRDDLQRLEQRSDAERGR